MLGRWFSWHLAHFQADLIAQEIYCCSATHVQFFVTPWTAARQASLSINNSLGLLKLMSIELVMPSTISFYVIPFFSCLQSSPASGSFLMNWLFASGGQSIGASASASVLLINTQDWFPLGLTDFDLLAGQGTLKSLLQYHSSKASILWHSAFFIVQLSHPYMTTGKTIALTRWTFIGKVISLVLNMLSRLVITFLPRSKRLLISWLQSSSSVILEPKINKLIYCFPIYLPWSDGTGCHDLSFWMLSFKPFFFHYPLHLHQEDLLFLFAFCHKGSIIWISEVIDVSSWNVDSSLCFIQPSISHDVLCM